MENVLRRFCLVLGIGFSSRHLNLGLEGSILRETANEHRGVSLPGEELVPGLRPGQEPSLGSTVLRLHCRIKDPALAAPPMVWKNKRVFRLAHRDPHTGSPQW